MTVTVTVTVCPCQADRRRRRRRRRCPPPGRRTVAVAFAVAGLLPQGPRHTCLRGSRCSRQPHRCRWPRRTCLRRSCCTQKSHRTQHTAPPDRPRSPWRQLIPRTDPRDTGCTDRRKSARLPTKSHRVASACGEWLLCRDTRGGTTDWVASAALQWLGTRRQGTPGSRIHLPHYDTGQLGRRRSQRSLWTPHTLACQ